jgi:hypothetical protein
MELTGYGTCLIAIENCLVPHFRSFNVKLNKFYILCRVAIVSRQPLASGTTPSISLTLRQAYEIRNVDGERVVCRGFLP